MKFIKNYWPGIILNTLFLFAAYLSREDKTTFYFYLSFVFLIAFFMGIHRRLDEITKPNCKEYIYYYSYVWFSETQTGFGSNEVRQNCKLDNYNHIKMLIETLNKDVKDTLGNPCNCVVLNFKLLRTK